MKNPGQRRGTEGPGLPFRDGAKGHSRICHPSVDDAVDRFPWRVISPHGNVRTQTLKADSSRRAT